MTTIDDLPNTIIAYILWLSGDSNGFNCSNYPNDRICKRFFISYHVISKKTATMPHKGLLFVQGNYIHVNLILHNRIHGNPIYKFHLATLEDNPNRCIPVNSLSRAINYANNRLNRCDNHQWCLARNINVVYNTVDVYSDYFPVKYIRVGSYNLMYYWGRDGIYV